MDPNEVRKKVLRKEGWGLALYPIFWTLSKLYCLISEVRNFLYNLKVLDSFRFPLPVISVGNITAGGSGKTPLTESIYLLLEEVGFSPTIVTRGYRGKERGPKFATGDPEKFGDEAATYAIKGYKTVVSKNKKFGIKFAFEKEANVVILDDGFQYRKIIPQINIVAIDPFNPFGDNHCLPLGLLREPIKNLERADCFVITRSNLVDQKRIESLELFLKTFKKPIFFAKQEFKFWVNEKFEKVYPPSEREIDVFCGIGNPEQFVRMLIQMGYKIRNYFIYEDHHEYTEEDVEVLKRLKNPVTTEKDLIKIRNFGIKAKAPVLRLESVGFKEFILANIKTTVRKEEEVEEEEEAAEEEE
ncbi:MAG: tetraacyldisaccharide 4'-kinase, partial [Desulfurobacteriaceae bacterium]